MMAKLAPASGVASRPKSARQWLSGVAGVVLSVSLVLPWQSAPDEASELFFSSGEIWKYGKLPAITLALVTLALFVWDPPQRRTLRLAFATVVVLAVLAALWLFWNATQDYSQHGPRFHPGIGFYAYLAGLLLAAIAGVALALAWTRSQSDS